MPYVSETTYQQVTNLKQVCQVCKQTGAPVVPGNPLYTETTKNVVDVISSEQYNNKISRTRPTGLLFKSPTALTEQYRIKKTYRVARWTSDQTLLTGMPVGCCPVGYAPYGVKIKVGSQSCALTRTKPVMPSDMGWSLKVRQKLEDQVVSLGETLMEYRETVNLFTSAARTVAAAWRQYRNIRRLRFRKLRLRDVAAAEVTSALGIAPTLGTVYDACDVLMNRLEEPIYRRVVAVVRERDSDVWADAYGSVEGTWETSQKAIFYFELDKEARRVEFGSPWEIAWELVPFSFVVDWFFPVGDWLLSLDALKGVKSTWGTVTQRQRYVGTDRRGITTFGQPDNQTLIRPGQYLASYHKRWVQNTVPVPVPILWRPSASWKRLMTATSLLTLLKTKP